MKILKIRCNIKTGQYGTGGKRHAAGIAIYEQIRENANVALYAKMAYTDMMTGLKNRAAFIDDSNRDAHTPGAVSYIMIDANNLKKVNDSLGHKRGDELLTTVARCMEAGVKGSISFSV